MSIKPTITKGIGALTPEVWNRLVDTIQWVEANKGLINNSLAATARIKTNTKTPDQGYILARITSVVILQGTGLGAYQWKYGFETIGVAGGAGGATPTTSNVSPYTSDADTWAINISELGNTSILRGGYAHVDDHISGSDGYRITQVLVGTVVQMFSTRHSVTSTRLQWFFNAQNPVTGVCPA